MAMELGTLTNANNVEMLNAIRHDASFDYQNRVPEATQAGLDNTIKSLMSWTPAYNEFTNALVNRIGAEIGRTQSWTNPLAEFKRGMLTWGDTVEEIQVGLLTAHTFDGNREYLERANFGRETPNVQANFHTVNRQEFYRITVSEPMLKRAFLTNGGLSGFVGQLMGAPIKSDNYDEFLLTCQLFREYEANDGFYKVNVPDVSSLDSTDADAKLALRKIRGVAGNLKFLSTMYNAAGMPMFANPDEMVLFCTPEFNAALDVNALAGAFNIDRAQIPNRIIEIPETQMGIDGCQAILTTRDFFVIMDQLMENRSQINAAGLATNYFWHHWQVISASRFVPAVMFTTKEGAEVVKVAPKITAINSIALTDIDGVPLVGTAVTRGMTYQATADITTVPVGSDARLGITWGVIGEGKDPRTSISQTGVLRIAGTEKATQLTVTAYDSNEEGNAELIAVDLNLTVTGDTAPNWPVDRA